MRLRQTVARLCNAEVAILRVGAQTVGDEIFVAIMTDGDALFRTSALDGGLLTRLDLAVFGLDLFSRRGFRGGPGERLARRRFFLRSATACCPRCRLLLGHQCSPFSLVEKG